MRWSCLLAMGVAVTSLSNALAVELLVGRWNVHTIEAFDLDTNMSLGNFVAPGAGGLSTPDGMDFGPDGNLYVSSSDTDAVLRFDGQTGEFIDEFATQGLSMPGNMKFGPDGLLYVSNKGLGQVLRFDPTTGDLIDVFADGGGLQTPVGLLWDDDLLYVTDFNGNSILRYDATTGDYVDTFANINTPLIMNLDPEGDLLVSSHGDSMIWEYDTATGDLLGPALNGGPVNCPVGHLFADGDLIVASWASNRVLRYAADGTFQGFIGFGLRPNDLLLRPIPEPGCGWLMMGLIPFLRWWRRGDCGACA